MCYQYHFGWWSQKVQDNMNQFCATSTSCKRTNHWRTGLCVECTWYHLRIISYLVSWISLGQETSQHDLWWIVLEGLFYFGSIDLSRQEWISKCCHRWFTTLILCCTWIFRCRGTAYCQIDWLGCHASSWQWRQQWWWSICKCCLRRETTQVGGLLHQSLYHSVFLMTSCWLCACMFGIHNQPPKDTEPAYLLMFVCVLKFENKTICILFSTTFAFVNPVAKEPPD